MLPSNNTSNTAARGTSGTTLYYPYHTQGLQPAKAHGILMAPGTVLPYTTAAANLL